MQEKYSVYFAGALFNHKELTGNALLAKQITSISAGKYRCTLPQDCQFETDDSNAIRDMDLKMLISSDCAIFNFDGSELDSGTVVEFMTAKFLDIPAVILRTDFRKSGDQLENNQTDNWNLMCSFYPRTENCAINANNLYREKFTEQEKLGESLENFYKHIASELVSKLDSVLKTQSVFNGSDEVLKYIYQWAFRFPGKSFRNLFTEKEIEKLIERKKEICRIPG